jgi:serine O-acetyltransferase
MDYEEYKKMIISDHCRYKSDRDWILRSFFIKPEFRYTFWLRTAGYFADRKGFISFLIFIMSRIFLAFYSLKYGLNISFRASIGHGLCIDHLGKIVISPDTRIGNNCDINGGVFVGRAYRGKHIGAPVIKDNVHIGPDSKIVGGIEVGNNVAIYPKSIVKESVPDNLVVMTLPRFLGLQQ